jgi:hypothetical protein
MNSAGSSGKGEYLKGKKKINELATNNKNKTAREVYREANEFKRGYQPRNNLVMNENGDCLHILTTFLIDVRTNPTYLMCKCSMLDYLKAIDSTYPLT